jgi:hypothetical protein
MQIGTKVTYTKKGYARDFIYTMTNLSEINNLKKEEYTQRKGTIIDIKKSKCGLVTFIVKWEDVAGYFEDDTSYVQDEDIQEIEEEVVEEVVVEEVEELIENEDFVKVLYNAMIEESEEEVEETSYIDTYVQFENLTDYYTFGRGMVVYLHYKDQRIEKRFSCVVEAMQHAIDIEKSR